jgi:hypothetical protein
MYKGARDGGQRIAAMAPSKTIGYRSIRSSTAPTAYTGLHGRITSTVVQWFTCRRATQKIGGSKHFIKDLSKGILLSLYCSITI